MLSEAQAARCLALVQRPLLLGSRMPAAFPPLRLAPLAFVSGLRHALLAASIGVADVRLEGSAASAVLAGEQQDFVSAGCEEKKKEERKISKGRKPPKVLVSGTQDPRTVADTCKCFLISHLSLACPTLLLRLRISLALLL